MIEESQAILELLGDISRRYIHSNGADWLHSAIAEKIDRDGQK